MWGIALITTIGTAVWLYDYGRSGSWLDLAIALGMLLLSATLWVDILDGPGNGR